MSKRSHRRQKGNRKHPQQALSGEYGFDLGIRRRVIFFSESDQEFNQELRNADVVGAAYGYQMVEGFPSPVPTLTLIGRNADGFRKAFDCFKRWGCEDDGDVVDLSIILKNDGSYVLTVGPEMERASFRMGFNSPLNEPLFVGLTWIKPIDTTNRELLRWRDHLKSPLAPIVFDAATTVATPQTLTPHGIREIPGLPQIIKFNMKITSEDEEPDNWFIKGGKSKPTRRGAEYIEASPTDTSRARREVIDTAFPVTRERVRKSSKVDDVRSTPGFEKVTFYQIVQSSVNLKLSDELLGKPHYVGLDDLQKKVWDHVLQRFEIADGPNWIDGLSTSDLCHQIELDTSEVFLRKGRTPPTPFRKLQEEFLRMGYGSA